MNFFNEINLSEEETSLQELIACYVSGYNKVTMKIAKCTHFGNIKHNMQVIVTNIITV